MGRKDIKGLSLIRKKRIFNSMKESIQKAHLSI